MCREQKNDRIHRIHVDIDGVPLGTVLKALEELKDSIVMAHVFRTKNGYHVVALAGEGVRARLEELADEGFLREASGPANRTLRWSSMHNAPPPAYVGTLTPQGFSRMERMAHVWRRSTRVLEEILEVGRRWMRSSGR